MNVPAPATHSPVRIYILWHPAFTAGLAMARALYHWFRLDTMEGIPVFFRSDPEPGSKRKEPRAIKDDCAISYIIPLVEANMVAAREWRSYVSELRARPTKPSGLVILPVALDTVAYQMPAALRGINFIRHELARNPPLHLLIGQLTEVLCRHLRDFTAVTRPSAANAAMEQPAKLRIFLSHAKADGTAEPVRLKEHIQGQTQCEAFYDETDLASGFDFGSALEKCLTEQSAGLIVVQGDNYADRPWCRLEVRHFLKPRKDTTVDANVYFVPPVLVVQTMQGARIARTIPELGHSACMRWTAHTDCERLVVTTLQREILLGLFYRMLARQIAQTIVTDKTVRRNTLVLNRPPDPVMLIGLLNRDADLDWQHKIRVLHPGYGLSRLEKEGLTAAFGADVQFQSFAEFDPAAHTTLEKASPGKKKPVPARARFENHVLAVSAGNASDILAWGVGDEHNRELLHRMLKPLFLAGMSVLYGGALPSATEASGHPLEPWDRTVNFTELFLNLLLSERDGQAAGGGDGTGPLSKSRLFNLSAWPHSKKVDARVRALWTDICSFITIGPDSAGLPELPPEPVLHEPLDPDRHEKRRATVNLKKEQDERHRQERLLTARCLTVMRQKAVSEMTCHLPDAPKETTISTCAHLFIGGKVAYASGITPGLFEEALYALEQKKPVFLPGCTRGATGLLARWFLSPPKTRPPELTTAFYKSADFKITDEVIRRHAARHPKSDPPVETASRVFDRLWKLIVAARKPGALPRIFHNQLTQKENRDLLSSEEYATICNLVETGLARCV